MRRTAPGALVLAAGLALAACGSSHSGPTTIDASGRQVPVRDLRDVVPGLCATGQAASQRAARAAFYDRSHAPLHQIVVAIEPTDRPLAGRLLEAMQRVEADLAGPEPPPERAADLAALVALTRRAFDRLSITTADCPKD